MTVGPECFAFIISLIRDDAGRMLCREARGVPTRCSLPLSCHWIISRARAANKERDAELEVPYVADLSRMAQEPPRIVRLSA